MLRAQRLDPDELHRTGLAALADLEEHIAELGRRVVGLRDVHHIMAWFREDVSLGAFAGGDAMARAATVIARAGRHAQFARLQLMPHPPRLLTAFYVVPHGEGWGLYAERLADEFGLYSDDTQRLGMLGCAAWRAIWLVVDSGLHSRGWTRDRAREFALAHSPMPAAFVDAEIDRYIAVPGQALGYLVGEREIARMREEARSGLGAAYDIRDFYSAVLDHGSVPLAVPGRIVADWVTSTRKARSWPDG